MTFLRYLARPRLSYIDVIFVAIALRAAQDGHFIAAIVICLAGSVVSGFVEKKAGL